MTDGRRRRRLRSALCAAALALPVLVARVRQTDSDPRLNLLTAQALLETGSVRLGRYLAIPGRPGDIRRDLVEGDWTVWRHAGHLYNLYPPGTSLLALPAVAVARAAGFDGAQPADDRRLQVLLSALVVSASLLLFEALARLHLSDGPAFATALVLVLGTSVPSTPGTALWSHGPSMLLAGLALLHLLDRSRRGESPSGATLGALLLGAWLCRPTAIVPALLAAIALAVRHRRQALPFVVVAGAGAALFAAACWAEYGLLLPADYGLGLALAVASVGIHSVQGLFDRATISWNDGPNADDARREKLFDWGNPLFAATWDRNRAARERGEATRRSGPAGGH